MGRELFDLLLRIRVYFCEFVQYAIYMSVYGCYIPTPLPHDPSVIPGCTSTKGYHCQGAHHKSTHTITLVYRVHCRILWAGLLFEADLIERLFFVGHSDWGGVKPSWMSIFPQDIKVVLWHWYYAKVKEIAVKRSAQLDSVESFCSGVSFLYCLGWKLDGLLLKINDFRLHRKHQLEVCQSLYLDGDHFDHSLFWPVLLVG